MIRAKMPRAADVAVAAAIEAGVCIRPMPMRRVNMVTGETTIVDVPCGATLASKCPSCAQRARNLRAQQCREGWHLNVDPDLTPDAPNDPQVQTATDRADLTADLLTAVQDRDEDQAGMFADLIGETDEELIDLGVRGSLDPEQREHRRARSTRRRQDAPDLPRKPSNGSTLGKVYTDPRTGKTFRPSTFLTITLPSYGRVRSDDSTPVNPVEYDYRSAARDAIHFAKLMDRLVQNLRRVAGYELQYFAAIEPQRRLAPHAHFAIRGTLPRAVIRQVIAATYHQVWWPPMDTVIYDGDRLPVWDLSADRGYLDPTSGEPLPTWDDALDSIGPEDEPAHVVRPGSQVDVQGVLAGSPQAEKCIGYLVKYLTKSLGDDLSTHDDEDQDDQDPNDAAAARFQAHRDRLVETLRYEPCSPTCTNWLRYGIQPKNPHPGQRPGCCRSKAHKPSHLGHGGRRVLTSRKWTGKTLTDHRADRRAFVLDVLGVPTESGADPTSRTSTDLAGQPDPTVFAWEPAKPTDPDVAPRSRRLLLAIAQRDRWRRIYRAALNDRDNRQPDLSPTPPATEQAA
jgi:hypothetical protein